MINVYARVFRRGREDLTFYLTMTIFYVAVGMQTVDILNSCGALNFVPYGYPSMHIFVIIVIFIAVYITFIVRTSREAFKASEYKLQLETLKTRVLREQINPHFTFNTLTVIKSQYHKDLQSGDEAVNMFSRHLRANVEAMDNDFIPFEKELDNLTNYVELQNLRFSSPFKIVYDIACVDFNIPVLSLQVFVENAIKYSKVNQKEDGYIEISSFEEGDVITLKVKDNGTGFNVNNINPNSCGIKNARERFKLLMNANVEIDSRIGVGTEVTITFKKQ
jgi:LytS/YehU family sensor histidine kinase